MGQGGVYEVQHYENVEESYKPSRLTLAGQDAEICKGDRCKESDVIKIQVIMIKEDSAQMNNRMKEQCIDHRNRPVRIEMATQKYYLSIVYGISDQTRNPKNPVNEPNSF